MTKRPRNRKPGPGPGDGEWMAHAGPPPEPLPPPDPDLDDDPAPGQPIKAELSPTLPVEAAEASEMWSHLEADMVAAGHPDSVVVTEGDTLRTLEWYFPYVWLGMMLIVAYIGIYYAVDNLPGGNPLPPRFEF